MKNRKIVIASHGEMAKGMISALRIIIGSVEGIEILCGYLDPDFDLDRSIQAIMDRHDFQESELIVCTDMLGGSINNGFTRYLKKYPFHLITNVNLPFLMDLILSSNSLQDDLLEKKVQEEMFGVKYVNAMLSNWESLEDI